MTKDEAIKYGKEQLEVFGGTHADFIKSVIELLEQGNVGELTCTNESQFHEADQFICSNCGIKLEGWSRIEYDEDTGDKTYYETSFKFCPNCGAKIESEVK